MQYCFVWEEVFDLCESDPLAIQCRYAEALHRCCYLHLQDGTVTDRDGQRLDLRGRRVLLRATCDGARTAMQSLQECGALLTESPQDMEKIEKWYTLGLAKRQICAITYADLLGGRYSPQLSALLESVPVVFIKTREKGFSAKVAVGRLLEREAEWMRFLQQHCKEDTVLLVSEGLQMKADSLGTKESRHFVLDGKESNASRQLSALLHTVPLSLQRAAKEMVAQLASVEGFPKNYVLDMGLFQRGGQVFADVVEINPLTTSLCYVNNSVFLDELPEIVGQNSTMGYEYRLDALLAPTRYTADRSSGKRYHYTGEDRFLFL